MLISFLAALAASTVAPVGQSSATDIDAANAAERNARVRCQLAQVHIPAGKTVTAMPQRCDALSRAVAARKAMRRTAANAGAPTGEAVVAR